MRGYKDVVILYLEDRPTTYLDKVSYYLYDRFRIVALEPRILEVLTH